MGIVATLGTLITMDRAGIARTGENALLTAIANDKRIEVLATDMRGQLQELRNDVAEIKVLLEEDARRQR